MNIILVSKCSLDIEQYVEIKISVLISPSKSLIHSCWVTIYCLAEGIWTLTNKLGIRFIVSGKISQIGCIVGLKRGQNRCIVGYILPSLQSHNGSNL